MSEDAEVYGSRKGEVVELTHKEYVTLYDFLVELAPQNWGFWPDPFSWPILPVAYGITQFGGSSLLVKFDAKVSYKDQCSRSWIFHMSRARAPKGSARLRPPSPEDRKTEISK